MTTLAEFRIIPSGPKVAIDMFFGQAPYAQYTVRLYDANGQNGQTIGEGNNIDPIPDRFTIPNTAKDLVGRAISWRLEIGAPTGGAGALYFARMTVFQGGATVPGSPVDYQGALDDAKLILGVGRFIS